MAKKNLFLQSPDAGDIEQLFQDGAANIAAMGLPPQVGAQTQQPKQSAPSSSFQSAVSRVLGHEGGYTHSDGNTGAPANFGINQLHNPDLDVKNITKDQAVERYKSHYWDAIDGDNLPPALQATALDAAVNQGPARAKEWLRQSGGDVQKFNALRRNHYEMLARRPEFAKYRNTWLKRLDSYEQPGAQESDRYELLSDEEAVKIAQQEAPIDTSRYELLTDDEVRQLPASFSLPAGMQQEQGQEQEQEQPQDVGFFERLPQAAKTGWENMNRSLDTTRAVLSDDFSPQTVDLIAQNIQAQIEHAKKDQSRQHASERELKDAIEEFGKTEGWGDTTKGLFSLLGTAVMNPKGVAIGTMEQLANMLPSIGGAVGGAAAGAGAGALAGSVIPGAGTAAGAGVGALWGSRAGLATGTAALEYGNEITEAITSRLEKQGKEPTKENIAQLLSDPKMQQEIKTQAAAKGLTLAAVDAVSMGLAGKVGARGVEAAKAGAKGKAAGYGAGSVGIELAGEPAGEAASQLVARGEIDKADVAAEGIYGAGTAIGTAGVGTAAQVARDGLAGKPAEPAPRQEPVVDVTYTDDQGNTVTEVVHPEPTGPISRAVQKAAPQQQTVVVDDEGGQNILAVDPNTGEISIAPVAPEAQEQVAPVEAAMESAPVADQAPSLEEFEAQFAGMPEDAAPVAEQTEAAQQPEQAPADDLDAMFEDAVQANQGAQEGGPKTTENESQPVENIEQQGGPETAEKPLTEWTEDELRARLKYVTQQAKSNGGWDARLTAAKKEVSQEIDRRNTEASSDNRDANTNAVPDAPVAQTGDQAVAADQGNQQARSAPDEVTAIRADGGQANAVKPEPSVGATVSGADAAAQPDAALSDPHKGRWFGSEAKAQAYIAKNKAGDTHEVVQTGKVRFEIKPKAAQAEAQVATVNDPVVKSQRAIVFQNTRSRLTRAYNGEEYRGKKEDYATLRADLEKVAADTRNPNSAQAKEVLDAVDQAIQNLDAKKRYKAERERAPAAQQPAATDADLDAMFDEAVDVNKQAQAAPKAKKPKKVAAQKTEAAKPASSIASRAKALGIKGLREGMSDEKAAKIIKSHLAGDRAAKLIDAGKQSGLPQYKGVSDADARTFGALIGDNPYNVDTSSQPWVFDGRGVTRADRMVAAGLLKESDAKYKHAITPVGKEIAQKILRNPVGDMTADEMLAELESAKAPAPSAAPAEAESEQKTLKDLLAEQESEIAQANAKHEEVLAQVQREMRELDSKVVRVRNKGRKRDELNDRVRESRIATEASIREILDRYRPIIDAHPEEIARRAESRRKAAEVKAQLAESHARLNAYLGIADSQQQDVKAGVAAKSNADQSLDSLADDLTALFGDGGAKFSVSGSAPAFDEATYAKAKPIFQQAVDLAGDVDIRQAMQAVVNAVMDKGGEATVRRMKPYVVRFIQEMRDAKTVAASARQTSDSESKQPETNSQQAPAATKSESVEKRAAAMAKKFAKPKEGRTALTIRAAQHQSGGDGLRFFAVDQQGEKIGMSQVIRIDNLTDEKLESMLETFARDAAIASERLGGARFSFAGENAVGANLDALAQAQKLEKNNASADAILRETGWHKGVDGKWRFEIDDSQAKFRQFERDWGEEDALTARVEAEAEVTYNERSGFALPYKAVFKNGDNTYTGYGDTREKALWNVTQRVHDAELGRNFNIAEASGKSFAVSDVLDHPQLLNAYPFIKSLSVEFNSYMKPGERGSYDERGGLVSVNANMEPEQQLSTLLHELQHAIQIREDFARGGNSDSSFVQGIRQTLADMRDGEFLSVQGWKVKNKKLIDDAETAGEVARNALKYESAQRLMAYANRESPSGVMRLIRNEMQWIYAEDFKGNEAARQLQYDFYEIPKPSNLKKRNAFLRDFAERGAQLLRNSIPAEQLALFKSDERTTKGMVEAMRRQARKAREKLKPLHDLEASARRAEQLANSARFKSPYEIYRSLAGEIEARVTQARQSLTAEQRRNRHPRLDADVSLAEAVVIVGGMEMQVPIAMSQDGPAQADFGPVTTDYRDDAKGAIDWLKKNEAGEAILNHPTLGEVSLVWGDENMGLAHIARRHGEKFLSRIPALLQETEAYTKPGQSGRVFLGNETDEATIRLDWNGQDKVWLVSAYEKFGEEGARASSNSKPARSDRLDAPTLRKEITRGLLGPVVSQLIESGKIVLHNDTKTLPAEARGVRGVQALVTPGNNPVVHMVARNLRADNAQAVLWHEMFHRGGAGVMGPEGWGNLMGDLGSLYRQANMTGGKLNKIWKDAAQRVASAKTKGAIATGMTIEEFGAYAIEEYSRKPDSLPAALKKWVEDFIGFVKAYLRKQYGIQVGKLTPAQLTAISKMALLNRTADLARAGKLSVTESDGQQSNQPPEELETFKPSDPSRFEKFQHIVQNNMNRVRKVQERIKELTGISDLGHADYYGAETNRPGRTAARLEDAREQMFKPLLKDLAKTKYKPKDLENLLHAMHAVERNNAIARINPDMPDGGSGMFKKKAEALLEQYKDAKELHELADRARAITKATLDLKRAYGLISAEEHEALTKGYQHYVPLKGDGEYGPKVKRAMGHEQRDEYILENIARDHEQAIIVGEKYLARQSLVAIVAQFPDENLWTIGMPPKGRYIAGQTYVIVDKTIGKNGEAVAEFPTKSQVHAFLEAKGHEASKYEVTTPDGEIVRTFVKPLQDNEVMTYIDGHPVRIQIKDEHLAKQLRPLDYQQMGVILEGARKVNRYLSSIYTGYNPYFILKNAVRDMITGTINMTGTQGAKVAAGAWKKYAKANAAIAKWAATGKYQEGKYGDMLREYRGQGGKTGASYMSDLEAQTRNLARIYEDAYGVKNTLKDGKPARAAWIAARKAVGGLAHTIEIANQATENALRLALYMELRERGEVAGKAAQAAKTVTVDFDRKGALTGSLGALYIFFNPAVQGTANAFNTLVRGKHKKQAWAALGMLATLGYFAATKGMDDDEDRWLGMGWDKRTKNFILSAGDHTLTIPLSQEFAPAYALGAAIGEASRGESSIKSTMRLVSSFIDAYIPLNGLYDPDSKEPMQNIAMAATPTAVRPLTELAFNRNVFGSQIVPESAASEGAPDNTKMNRATKGTPFDSASQMIAEIGAAFGEKRYEDGITKISPETLKYLWATYTGGLGRFVTDTVGISRLGIQAPDTVSSSEIPFVKDFWQAHDVKPIRGRYYELADEAKEAAAQFGMVKRSEDERVLAEFDSDTLTQRLVAMNKMFTKQNVAIRAIREEQLAVSTNDKLPLADKRRKLKELEAQEEELYRQAIEVFKGK